MSQFPPQAPRSAMHGYTVGLALCNVLNLDPHSISEITLHCAAGEVATVEIVRFLSRDEVGQIEELVSRFTLTAETDP